MAIILDRSDQLHECERLKRVAVTLQQDTENLLGRIRDVKVPAKDEIAEFCYCQIRDSPLWDDATLNSVIDVKAEELAEVIEQTLNEWFRKQSGVSEGREA